VLDGSRSISILYFFFGSTPRDDSRDWVQLNAIGTRAAKMAPSAFAEAAMVVVVHIAVSRAMYYRTASRVVPRIPMKALCVVFYMLGAAAQLPGISAAIAALSHIHYLDTTFMDHPDMYLVLVHHAVLLFHCDCVALASPTTEASVFNRLGFLGMALVHSGILGARLLHERRGVAFAIRCCTPIVGLAFNCAQLYSLRGAAEWSEPHAVALAILVLELLLLKGEVQRRSSAVTPGLTSPRCARPKGPAPAGGASRGAAGASAKANTTKANKGD
jgi:hypothetical protein